MKALPRVYVLAAVANHTPADLAAAAAALDALVLDNRADPRRGPRDWTLRRLEPVLADAYKWTPALAGAGLRLYHVLTEDNRARWRGGVAQAFAAATELGHPALVAIAGFDRVDAESRPMLADLFAHAGFATEPFDWSRWSRRDAPW